MSSLKPGAPESERTSIRVHGLGVRYSLRFTRKTTLRQSFTRRVRRHTEENAFWALRDVTFDVVHGESLGVIGPNGAGKSTLLQVLAGIITPSAGVVEVDGHISSLLTLGAGFDADLSGRDNIRLAGAFMGLDHRWVAERTPSIIEYADLGPFIDAPIKTYSSGMRARLGFAIATSVEPDILLLDEVLSTGDAEFRAKSKARVLELVKQAKAIVLVTHDMNWVTEYCNKAMLLERGRIVAEGAPADVVAAHIERAAQRRAARAAAGVLPVAPGSGAPAGVVGPGAATAPADPPAPAPDAPARTAGAGPSVPPPAPAGPAPPAADQPRVGAADGRGRGERVGP